MYRQQVTAIRTCLFFNDTATTEIYTLSLHDALPISSGWSASASCASSWAAPSSSGQFAAWAPSGTTRRLSNVMSISRSEEHTSELQSRQYLVCRLLLEKKKKRSRLCLSHSHISQTVG